MLHHLLDYDDVWKAYQRSDYPQVGKLLGKRFIRGSELANIDKRAELIARNVEEKRHDIGYIKKIASFLKEGSSEKTHVRVCDAVELLCPLLKCEPLDVFRLLYEDNPNNSELKLKKFEQAYLEFLRKMGPKERRVLKPYFDTYTEEKASILRLCVSLNKLNSSQIEQVKAYAESLFQEQ